jgi:hypothetical protein
MGIRGLAKFLKQRAATAYTTVSSCSKTEIWAIDCSCIMYRARSASLQPVTVLAALIVKLRSLRVEPVVIFDGRPPEVKTAAIEERRAQRETIQHEIDSLDPTTHATEIAVLQRKIPNVTAGDKDAVKQLLYAAGVLFINATGEADDLIAALYRKGDITAVLSTDMDMLPRGIGRLIVPETPDASILTCIHLDRILSTLALTYDQFVTACILMGTDYSGRSLNPHQAVLAAVRPAPESSEAHLLKGEGVAWSSLLSPAQEEKRVAGAPPTEPAVLTTFASTYGWPPGWVTALQVKLTPGA